jgi:hypothetical protein
MRVTSRHEKRMVAAIEVENLVNLQQLVLHNDCTANDIDQVLCCMVIRGDSTWHVAACRMVCERIRTNPRLGWHRQLMEKV